jgi:hypothetical protein
MSSLYLWTHIELQQSRLGFRGRNFSLFQWTDSLEEADGHSSLRTCYLRPVKGECLDTALLYPEMPVAELRDDLQ